MARDGTTSMTIMGYFIMNNNNNKYRTLEDYPDVLTVSDVQKILRVGRNTAYQLFRGNGLRTFKAGGQLRCTKAALMEFLGEPDKN